MKPSSSVPAKKRDGARTGAPRTAPVLGPARYFLPVVLLWAIAVAEAPATPSGAGLSRPGRTAATPHPAVVRVIVPEGRSMSLGSGTLVAVNGRHGLVVTNWHVIRDAGARIEVAFPDGFRSTATLLAADRDWDLAALAIWRPNVQPIPLAAEAPWPGDPLTIAGYGSGRYRTATGRCVQYVSPGANHPFEMVELAASAREGDSGGPILNQRGELAGVLFGATWGRTAGSHTVPVRRFLASVSDKFNTLAEPPVMVAQVPQAGDGRPGQSPDPSVRYAQAGSEPSVSRTDVVTARPSSRIAADASGPSAKLDVDGWAASGRTDGLAARDVSLTGPSGQADAAPAFAPQVHSEKSQVTQPRQWHDWLGTTQGEKLKTVLAVIGLLAIFLHAWRMLGNG